jgi:O-methyltransferase
MATARRKAREFLVSAKRRATPLISRLLLTDTTSDLLVRLPNGVLAQIDPTLHAPPGYSRSRANRVYDDAFRICIEYLIGAGVQGPILEFGTYRGFTARIFATLMNELQYREKLYLYDSFEGFPDTFSEDDIASYEVTVRNAWVPKGIMPEQHVDQIIKRQISRIIGPKNVVVTKGYFEATVPRYLPTSKAALLHVDCDLYSSAKHVLEQAFEADILQDGMLIIFDDYNCNRASPVMGERRALVEVFGAQSRFEYSSFFPYGWHGHAFFVHDTQATIEAAPTADTASTTGGR